MGVIRDIRDWFHERGDDIFGVDKKVEKLELHQLLPDEVSDILTRLDEQNQEAIENYEESDRAYREASDRRKDCYQNWQAKIAEFQQFKETHHGIIGSVMYNLPPLRFFSVGKEYQRLKREIKVLKREHKFWVRCSDEKNHIFEQAIEYRKDAKRALSEYKRIIVQKAKLYKKEFKLYTEYEKLNLAKGYKRIDREFGRDITDKLDNFLYYIRENWFDKPLISAGFDVKAVTKAVIDITRGKRLNDAEITAMREVRNWNMMPVNGPQQDNPQQGDPQQDDPQQDDPQHDDPQQDDPQQDDPQQDDQQHDNQQHDDPQQDDSEPDNQSRDEDNDKDDIHNNIKPPVQYDQYGLDRRAVEEVAKSLKDKIDTDLTPEEFLTAMAISNEKSKDINETAKRVKQALKNNPNDPSLAKYANKGAELMKKMLKGEWDIENLQGYMDTYKAVKEKLDKNKQERDSDQQQL